MPIMRKKVTATIGNAIANEKHRIISSPRGAFVSLSACGVTTTDDIGLVTGEGRELVPPGTDVNIEPSADVIDRRRDMLVEREWVPGGTELYVPCTVTTEMQFLLEITPVLG